MQVLKSIQSARRPTSLKAVLYLVKFKLIQSVL